MNNSDPVALLELYQTCFNISLAVALISLALAIFLFLKLDIRGVVKRRSGHIRKRNVRRIEQRSLETGRLAANEMLDLETAEQTGGKTGGRTGKLKKKQSEWRNWKDGKDKTAFHRKRRCYGSNCRKFAEKGKYAYGNI